jgi:RNA polymerase sigma-70 factor (ECF subfamily)
MDKVTQASLFDQGVAEHMGIVLKTAYGFTAEKADRDDLVQEILLSFWQALPWFDGRCKLSTFLYRVANNRALNWHRSTRRYRQKIQGFQSHLEISHEEADTAAQERKLAWLYAVIRRLPPLDRTLLMLQLDQLPHREIAEITGLSESNVGVRLHRIKHWLSQQNQNQDEL